MIFFWILFYKKVGLSMKLKMKILLITSVIIIISISLIAIYNTISTNQAFSKTINLQLQDELDNFEAAIESSDEIVAITKDALNKKNIDLTFSIAKMIDADPTLLEFNKMSQLATDLNVQEIHVIDRKGVLLYGNIEGFYGFDFNTSDQTLPFIDLIGKPGSSLAQDPSPRGTDNVLFQYIGVSRVDEPGIVQIGIEPKVIQDLIDNLNIQKRVDDLIIGSSGFALLVNADGTLIAKRDLEISELNATEVPWLDAFMTQSLEFKEVDINGVSYYAMKKAYKDNLLVVTYPTDEIDKIFNASILSNIIVIILTTLGLIIIISTLLNRLVIKPIKLLQSSMKEVGEGNFKVAINYSSKDEIGQLTEDFKKMTNNVSELIVETKGSINTVAISSKRITENVEGLTVSSNEVTRAVEEIANGTSVMAENVNERLMAGQKLGESVNQIYSKLSKAEKVSKDMVNSNQTGIDRISSLSSLFQTTIDNTNEVAANVTELSANSKAIETIVVTIKGIADQTNLLALNASIEAARAGESGRGFAVVAEEIRKLAEQSSTSAEEINSIIGSIVQTVVGTSKTVENTQQSVDSVKQNLNETVVVFDSTVESVNKVEEIISEFISETKIIENLKNELIASLESMAAISQESAASTEEINASTEEQLSRVTEIGQSIESLNEDILRLAEETKRFNI